MLAALPRYGIPLMFAIGIFAFLYVLFAAGSKTNATTGLAQFKTGALSALEIIPDPPPIPARSFRNLAGDDVRLGDWDGKVRVVNLWATWCPPCLVEMPTLAAMQRQYGSDRFEVLAVSLDRDSDRDMAIRDLNELSDGALQFLHDPSYGLAFDLKARGLPTTVIYDASGAERARLPGEADWSSAEAYGLVEMLLNERRVEAP